MAYTLPQVKVFQEFSQLPVNVIANLNAFVFGPQYQLFRYDVPAEKEFISLGAYDADNDTVYSYPNKPTGSSVDLDYVKLVMENVWAQYAVIGAAENTPLVCVSTTERNKLRAMPRIGTPELAQEGSATVTKGVGLEAGGYIYNGPSIPEAVYLYPYGGSVGNCLARLSDAEGNADDATLKFITHSEGQSGTVPVLATDNPLTSGTTIPGPYGLQLDFDAGTRTAVRIAYTGQPTAGDTITIDGTEYEFDADVVIGATARATFDNLKAAVNTDVQAATLTNVDEAMHEYGATTAAGSLYIIGETDFEVTASSSAFALENANSVVIGGITAGGFASMRQPVRLKVQNTAGTSYFTIVADPDAFANIVDEAIDNVRSLKFQYASASGTASVTWSQTTRRVTLSTELGVDTLDDVRDALVGNSDVAAVLDMSAITGDPTATADMIVDETTSPVTESFDVFMVPDVYRIKLLANDITFATGNGTNRSAIFKSRDVQVGDKLRYSVLGGDGVTYTGTTSVVAVEPDVVAPLIGDPLLDTANAVDTVGDLLTPHVGLDVVLPGADNQRDFDGVKTKVYALSSDALYFPGDYSNGVLDDTFIVTITTGGAAGAARATVRTASGNYSRLNVPITPIHWYDADEANMAMLYIGHNLWLTLHKGSGDSDALFKVGDTYTFSRAITAPWTAIPATDLTKGGSYIGPVDTTYVIRVTRGGVFDRKTTVIDGLVNANKAVITYTGQPVDADTITAGGIVFEFTDDATNTGTPVAISGVDADATYANLVDAINASAAAIYALQDTDAGTVTIRGSYTDVSGVVASATNATVVLHTAKLTPEMDFDLNEWLAGDVDDEYILRCTVAGTLSTARFTVESQRGDNVTSLSFGGSGNGNEEPIGSQGLHAYFTVSAPDVAFAVGDHWVLRVVATRPQVTITDTAGIDQTSVEVVNDDDTIDLGLYGATVAFADNRNTESGFGSSGGLVTGDTFYVPCYAASEGPYKTLVLADDLPTQATCGLEVDNTTAIPTYDANYSPTEFSVWLYLVQAVNQISSRKVQAPPLYNWEADADGVTVYENLQVQDSSWTNVDGVMPYLPVYAASMYLEYRALLPTYADTIYSLQDIADVVTTLGTVHPDNPLAQGVYNALSNSGDQPVYFMAVPSDDFAGYSAVLDSAAKVDSIYGMCALTTDTQVLNTLEAHVNAMSGEEEKHWRIAFVGSELPTTAVVYNDTNHPTGGVYTATITLNPAPGGSQFTLVEFTAADETVATRDISVGDKVRIQFRTDAWGAATYDEYVVSRVLSNTKLLLSSGPAVPISTAAKVEVYHPRSSAEIATAVAALSTGYMNRRIYHVFPSRLYMNGIAQGSEFGAAALVGLVSSVPPQQGLTNIEVNGFDDVPAVYSTYNRQQLNEMAEAGTFILMQDAAGGTIYVRHQLSTATSAGNLNTSELSITKNLDAISYYFVGVLSPYIGRYNVTPDLLDQLYTEVDSGINFLGSEYTASGLLGPMLIRGENTFIRSLEQHPTLKDHVVIILDLELPVPLNVIQLHLVV